MKRFLVAAIAAIALGFVAAPAAQPAAAAGFTFFSNIPGDVTGILGSHPVFPNGTTVSLLNQQSAGQFAKRIALVAGTITMTFANAYNSTPVCTVSGEAAANINTIRGVPSTTTYVVTSYSAASTVASSDTQFVDIHCVGNPN